MTWLSIPSIKDCKRNDFAMCKETFITSVMTHELLHNIGIYHSSSITDGNIEEYGDFTDPSGSTWDAYPTKLNLPHMMELGWINKNILINPDENIFTLDTMSKKSYFVKSRDVIGLIFMCGTEIFYISYRTKDLYSFDANLSEYDKNRIYIHEYNPKNDENTLLHGILLESENYLINFK
jgi:hypothetical protein